MRVRGLPWDYILFIFFCLSVPSLHGAEASQVEAVTGSPFGVARVTLPFPAEDRELPLAQAAVRLVEPANRVHYPAVTDGIRRPLLGGGLRRGADLTVMFLFEGDTPFELTLGTPTRQRVTVTPKRRSRLVYRAMLRRWWRGYRRSLDSLTEKSHHPPLIQTYLTSMLARRLHLQTPLVRQLISDRAENKGYRVLELLSGAGAAKSQMTKSISLGEQSASRVAELPLPTELDWNRKPMPRPEREVTIEPLAKRVPEECFYIRFGQYSNMLWLNTLLEEYGGELKSMISARGYRRGVNQRIHDQLAVHQGPLARLLGSQAIVDVAVIGMDTFTREGAAIGVVFETQGPLLGVDLLRQRQMALARGKENGATVTSVKIRGRDVSFLSTPHNQLRSYYVVDDEFHLVTNTREIVERFLDVGDGKGSLGASGEFHHARSVLPIDRQDTMFIYFSSAFFRNLLSPRYQIELDRRLRAATGLELAMLSRLAARGEGRTGETVEELVASGLLPDTFEGRPGQSRPITEDSRVVDSRRGQHGFFTPVPDTPVKAVSAVERERYLQRADYYAEHPKQIDPILIALKRHDLEDDGCERITMDAFMTPVEGFKYRLPLSLLGEPSPYKLVPPEDNLILIDAAVRGATLSPDVPPHRLFLGVQNREPLTESGPDDVLRWLRILRTAPGFLGAWPKPGFLDAVPFVPQDIEGISNIPFGLLRWQGRGFSVLSWDQDILTEASEQLGFVEEDHSAQVRIHVKDLRNAKFRGWLNQLGHERAYQVSVANARLMSILTQQFKVPQSESRGVAEQLLDAELVCALGGKYEVSRRGDENLWTSTAWPAARHAHPPADYTTPLLHWFRGLRARVVKHPDRLVLSGHLDLHRKTDAAGSQFPFFDMFGGTRGQESEPGESN
ncbi:MAG: hypothetical protein ACQESR_20695 [Planctomycetota bacterium]